MYLSFNDTYSMKHTYVQSNIIIAYLRSLILNEKYDVILLFESAYLNIVIKMLLTFIFARKTNRKIFTVASHISSVIRISH